MLVIDMNLPASLTLPFGPKETCIKWGPDPPCEGAIIRGKDMLGMPYNTLP